MSDLAIRVEGLSKRYRIGARQRGYQTLRDRLAEAATAPLRLLRSTFQPSNLKLSNEDTIWALKDVSFDVKQGEVVGIIGRNGAGKSTLLKILSRITAPTAGQVEVYGRVGSLLEVGTGFHPELTGRENIYLNGAILGMRKAEIDRRFDEIVAFAEVEKFLDTPVRHYSSGMYVRLAFAVAAHLEPEILLVDEVLAVGDAAFQKKCMGKMGDVAKEGRTVLFVSHNMPAVSGLCSRALVLKDGFIEHQLGTVDSAIDHYLMQIRHLGTTRLEDRRDRQGDGNIRITDFALFDREGNRTEVVISGQYVQMRIYYECSENVAPRNVRADIGISFSSGAFACLLSNQLTAEEFWSISHRGYMACSIAKLPLPAGSFLLNLAVRQNEIMQDWIQEAAVVVVENGDYFGTGRAPSSSHNGFFLEQRWSVHQR